MNDNVLTERAAGLGIDAGFYDINGMYHVTKPEVMEAIVHTLQQNHVSDGLFSDGLYDDTVALHEFRQERVSVPAGFLDAQAVMVRTEGGETLPARLCEENGSAWVLLPELPCGYHNLSVYGDGKSYQVMLIVAPDTVYRPAGLSDGLRIRFFIAAKTCLAL